MKPNYSPAPLWAVVLTVCTYAQVTENPANATDGAVPKNNELVVTSTPLHETPLEVAQPTSVLAGDELRRQIAASIGETLSGELGIRSTYFGPSASQPVIRGLGGYRVQVLQDGAPSLDVSSLSQDHAVSIESVVSRQIEIVKGPATLLYGSGAAGGLINVVTSRIPMERAGSALSGAVELRGDTATEERTGAFGLDGGSGALAFHADYFDRETNDVKIPDGRIGNSAGDTQGGAAGVSFAGDKGFGGLSWSRYESTYGIPVEEQAFVDMKQDRLDGRSEWQPGGAWLDTLHLSGSHSDYTHTEFERPEEPGTIFNQQAYELRTALDHHWSGQWRGTLGSQFVYTDFEALGDEAFVPPSVTRAASLFVFEERHLERWTIELGARAENQTVRPDAGIGLSDYDETAINLSTGWILKFAPDRALALNVTRTQRHPQAAELYAQGAHLAAGRIEIGDAMLNKESAWTADMSLRASGPGLRWTLNAFYNDYSNYIFPNPTGVFEPGPEGDPLPVFNYLQAGARLYGYEAEVIFPLLSDDDSGMLDLRLASDYVRGRLDGGGNLPQMPPVRFGAALDYEVGQWHAGIEAFYTEKQDKVIENELPTGSYTMVNLDLSYRMPLARSSLLLFIRGTNLLDEVARLHTSPLKEIAPLPGRSALAGVRMEF